MDDNTLELLELWRKEARLQREAEARAEQLKYSAAEYGWCVEANRHAEICADIAAGLAAEAMQRAQKVKEEK